MVITSRKLQENMGVSSRIADYFANERAVPADNLFWKNKRIYISAGFGYLTIPLIYDLVYKLGVPEEELLAEEHVSLMEKGFNNFILYEHGQIDFSSFLEDTELLLRGRVKQHKLAEDLFELFKGRKARHFQFESTHSALARSDSFLFALVDLNVTDEWVIEFLPYWYSIARPILLLDDFKDLPKDRVNQEENTIIELGDNKNAVNAAYEMGMEDLRKLETINPKLAKYMSVHLSESLLYDHIKGIHSSS